MIMHTGASGHHLMLVDRRGGFNMTIFVDEPELLVWMLEGLDEAMLAQVRDVTIPAILEERKDTNNESCPEG